MPEEINQRDWIIDTHGYREIFGSWVEAANYPRLMSEFGAAVPSLVLALGASLIFNAAISGQSWEWDGEGAAPGDLTSQTTGIISGYPSPPVDLRSLALWLYHDGAGEFGADQELSIWLDANPTPQDYSLVDHPGMREEVFLATLPFTDFVPGWTEFVFPEGAVELIRSLVVGQASWDGRLSIVVMRGDDVGSGFYLWGSRTPFLRAGFVGDVVLPPPPTEPEAVEDAQLAALEAAIKSGHLDVRYADKMIRYSRMDELLRARNLRALELGLDTVFERTLTDRRIRVVTRKGF